MIAAPSGEALRRYFAPGSYLEVSPEGVWQKYKFTSEEPFEGPIYQLIVNRPLMSCKWAEYKKGAVRVHSVGQTITLSELLKQHANEDGGDITLVYFCFPFKCKCSNSRHRAASASELNRAVTTASSRLVPRP